MTTCAKPECDRPVRGRGKCGKHWDRGRSPQPHCGERFPLQPLIGHLGLTPQTTEYGVLGVTEQIARFAGVTKRQVNRWTHAGLTGAAADQLAIRAGTHPALVWPEWLGRDCHVCGVLLDAETPWDACDPCRAELWREAKSA